MHRPLRMQFFIKIMHILENNFGHNGCWREPPEPGESSSLGLWVSVDLKQATLLLEQRNIPTHAILALVIWWK